MNKANESAQDILQNALRKAEMQHLQLQLEIRFKKNMEMFKGVAKSIYDQFIDYQPEELRLSFDEQGYLNLVNYKLNNKPVYSSNPVQFTKKQFEAFCHTPTMSAIRFGKSKIINLDHKHPQLVNACLDEYTAQNNEKYYSTNGPIGFMLMTGCGLGYQIEHFVNELDIRNLCIYDPHKDSFYAALHAIDWTPILQKMTGPGRMLKFLIGVTPMDAMADMKLLGDRIGLYNLVYTFIYRHFSSVKEDEFIELYRKEFHLNASGTGFFDDEQVSLAHTINNINSGAKFFKYSATKPELPPAFVIGNGPSLDEHIEYIREHAPNAVIFSCGTSIASLYKVGIKPDFHVEMERNSNTASWIEHGTPESFRSDLTLLCLNTIAPEVAPLFADACLAVKPNDVGQHIIEGEFPGRNLLPLMLCNPTVTNAGLSFALTMGFKEVYLFGVDLGVRADGAHHSSLSLYYDLEKKTKQKGYSGFERKEGDYEIPGNFDDIITTNPILHSTKTNMEILMRHLQRSGVEFNVYNPNRGAFIDGAQPIEQKDLPTPTTMVDKYAAIQTLKDLNFYTPQSDQLTEEYLRERYLTYFFNLRKSLTLSKNIKNMTELHDEMFRIYKLMQIAKRDAPVTCLLLRGSINTFFSLLSYGVTFCKDKHEFKKLFLIGRKYYMEMLTTAYQLMESDPLRNDTTEDQVAIKLKD